eukprot:TRINITY_DN162_c0_g1_i1.p1 TRINITY_DN162_c0_g1~~TRINITY_DN162_c0_g1_i1.p1  ORF type:complete len:1279 (+),score=597.19 TRINITY_DN162_c0_g1_i1:162-3998(+)
MWQIDDAALRHSNLEVTFKNKSGEKAKLLFSAQKATAASETSIKQARSILGSLVAGSNQNKKLADELLKSAKHHGLRPDKLHAAVAKALNALGANEKRPASNARSDAAKKRKTVTYAEEGPDDEPDVEMTEARDESDDDSGSESDESDGVRAEVEVPNNEADNDRDGSRHAELMRLLGEAESTKLELQAEYEAVWADAQLAQGNAQLELIPFLLPAVLGGIVRQLVAPEGVTQQPLTELQEAVLASDVDTVTKLVRSGVPVANLDRALARNNVIRGILSPKSFQEAPAARPAPKTWKSAVHVAARVAEEFRSGRIDEARRLLADLQRALPELRQQTIATAKTCGQLTAQAEKLSLELIAKRGQLETQLTQLHKQVGDAQRELDQVKATIDIQNQGVNHANEKVKHAKHEYDDAVRKLHQKKEVGKWLWFVPVVGLAYDVLDELINKTKAHMQSAIDELKTSSERLKQLTERRDKLNTQLAASRQTVATLETQVPPLSASIKQVNDQVTNIKSVWGVFKQAEDLWDTLAALSDGSVSISTAVTQKILASATAALPGFARSDGAQQTIGTLQSSWSEFADLLSNKDAFLDVATLSSRIAEAMNDVPEPFVTVSNVWDRAPDFSEVVCGGTWNSGNSAPQWIELDFGIPTQLDRLELTVEQLLEGSTRHVVLGGLTSPATTVLKDITGNTKAGQQLKWKLEAGAYRFIRIVTTTSPSWVGWKDIVAYNKKGRSSKRLNFGERPSVVAREAPEDSFVPGKVVLDDEPSYPDKKLYSLLELPLKDSKAVTVKMADVLLSMNLDDVVSNLGRLSSFVQVALLGTRGFSKLYIPITDISYKVSHTILKAAVTMRMFKDTSTQVSGGLKAAYSYLGGGNEDLAMSHIAASKSIATKMSVAAKGLSDEFGKLAIRVENIQLDVLRERGAQEDAIKQAKADQDRFNEQKQAAEQSQRAALKAAKQAQNYYNEAKAAEDKANERAFVLGITGAVLGLFTSSASAITKAAMPGIGAGLGAAMGVPPPLGAAVGGSVAGQPKEAPKQPTPEPAKPNETADEKKAREARNAKALEEFKSATSDFQKALNEVGDKQSKLAEQYMSEKQRALERLWEQQDKEEEALRAIMVATQQLTAAQKTESVSQAAATALSAAVTALKSLASLMTNAATFWEELELHCSALGENLVVDDIMTSVKTRTLDQRRKLYGDVQFQQRAILYYVDWLALQVISEKYVQVAIKSSKTIDAIMRANPDANVAEKDLPGLADRFLDELGSRLDKLSNIKNETKAVLEN